jgi:hypothetical protein
MISLEKMVHFKEISFQRSCKITLKFHDPLR